MQNEFLEPFLPEGIFEWFNLKQIERSEQGVRIVFEEKNTVPEIPAEHRGKKIISKGFKELLVDDFPIRGRKAELLFLRRVWQIEGVKNLLTRPIELCAPGTKLEKEFAAFLKEMG